MGSEKIWDRGAALPSRLHWFETEVLSQDENLDGLGRINRELITKAETMDSPQRAVRIWTARVYGEQEHSAYNGHFESRRAITRCCSMGKGQGNVFRAGAEFAKAEIDEAPEEQGVKYAIRLPANDMLESCSLGWGSS
ncbi:MAG: hypothetical protein ACYDCM_05500 [Candidatus Acidiferrales bacterium]